MPKIRVAELDSVPEGGSLAFDVAGLSVLVCRSAGGVFAVENRCTHNGSPLEGGRIRGHILSCPVHGARFDLRDGSTAGALTKAPIRTFPVEIVDRTVFVLLEPAK